MMRSPDAPSAWPTTWHRPDGTKAKSASSPWRGASCTNRAPDHDRARAVPMKIDIGNKSPSRAGAPRLLLLLHEIISRH